jgi:hypothetical protein
MNKNNATKIAEIDKTRLETYDKAEKRFLENSRIKELRF